MNEDKRSLNRVIQDEPGDVTFDENSPIGYYNLNDSDLQFGTRSVTEPTGIRKEELYKNMYRRSCVDRMDD